MQRDDYLQDLKDLTCDEPVTPIERACLTLCIMVVVGGFGWLAYLKWFA